MKQKPLLVALGVLVLALGALGIYWARRPRPAAPPAALTSGPAVPAAFTDTEHDNGFGERVPVVLTEDKTQLAKYYQLPYVKEFYDVGEGTNDFANEEGKHHAALPPLDLNQPLTGKSYLDLLLLRNTLYARNGYCFMNSTVRRYFDRCPWYRPLWEEDVYNNDGKLIQKAIPLRVPLNQREAAFAQRLHAQELALLAHRVTPQSGYPMLGLAFVVNQGEEPFTPAMRPVLARNNFVIVPTREEQLFYLYDQNDYSYTPNFVTTDLILQLLHKYLNGILSDVEEERLGPVVTQLLRQGGAQAQALAARCQQPQARDAAEWAAAYYAIGRNLLTGEAAAGGTYAAAVATEVASGTGAEGKGSDFLNDSLYDYTALKPRGMYTRTDTTRRYFRAVKWLNTAPVFLDSDAGLLRAVALAQALAASPQGAQSFAQLTGVLDVLVGAEDNRSLTHLLRLLRADYAGQSLDQLAANPAALARLRQQLVAAGTDRIRTQAASERARQVLARPRLLFTAGRYTFDGEVLSRLVNVLKPKPTDVPKRPFPKGLDVFATLGNQTAEDLLLAHYHEAAAWPAYPDTLRVLQRQFASFKDWNQNLNTKTMQVLLGLNAPNPDSNPPYFARTPAWQRRNLSTALGGWAELKHDLLLYTEQPSGAEMGGAEMGPPAPDHLGYVEPNLPFWERALGLLAFQRAALNRLHANTPHLDGLNQDISKLVSKLHGLAKKEVAHQPLTTEEMEDLVRIGGEVEILTIEILKTAQLPDRERQVALAADVYAFNEEGAKQGVLEEAVGNADALYVVVEINGVPVLARGAIFSYYEFINDSRLTDEEWQAHLKSSAPARPTWLRDLIVPVPKLNKNSRAAEKGSVGLPYLPG